MKKKIMINSILLGNDKNFLNQYKKKKMMLL